MPKICFCLGTNFSAELLEADKDLLNIFGLLAALGFIMDPDDEVEGCSENCLNNRDLSGEDEVEF